MVHGGREPRGCSNSPHRAPSSPAKAPAGLPGSTPPPQRGQAAVTPTEAVHPGHAAPFPQPSHDPPQLFHSPLSGERPMVPPQGLLGEPSRGIAPLKGDPPPASINQGGEEGGDIHKSLSNSPQIMTDDMAVIKLHKQNSPSH